ncbi:MAG: ABC transporter ATP-binding protein/permease [Candidatus Omnitrophica bacterium]|jgi:subfamily B ATP-binding cassette protein MsbA|nr:ABC transporter ATP-binding protein/permease [Candidatus Omnitrophota bacterium]
MFKEFLKIRKYVKFSYPYLIGGIIASIVTSVTSGISFLSIVPLMDKIFAKTGIVLPKNLADFHFFDVFVAHLNILPSLVLLRYILFFIIFVIFLKGLTFYLETYFLSYFSNEITRDIRKKIYEKIQYFSMKFFTRKRTGEITTRITYDVGLVSNIFSREIPLIFMKSIESIFYLLVIFFIDWKLSLSVIIILPIIIFPILNLGKKLRKLTGQIQSNYANLGNVISESIYAQPVIKAYNQEERIIKKFSEENNSIFRLTISIIKRTGAISPFTEIVTTIVACFIIFMGVEKVLSGSFSPGFLLLYLTCLGSLINPVKTILSSATSVYQSSSAFPRIYSILEEETEVKDYGQEEFVGIKKEIEFSHVWFKYANIDVIKDFNLKIKAGEKIGVVGHIGAGKSTISGLLLRFYAPEKGEILFDGKPINTFTMHSLREHIGLVTQEPFLFSDTIRNNIIFGLKDISDEKFENIVKITRVSEFIESFPQEYETVIGERGLTLSGGQKQLICLARAMLKNPSILILDEISASLDADSEKFLHQALDNVIANRTVIFIAHRLSTVKNLDRIIVLKKGQIEEEGTHQQLLIKNGLYAYLWGLQYSQAKSS